MYAPDENQRTFLDVKRWIPYLNIPHYEYHPKDKNMFRTHTPTYKPFAMKGKQIVWLTTNYVTGTPDTNIMKPYNPKLKSATQRFTQF